MEFDIKENQIIKRDDFSYVSLLKIADPELRENVAIALDSCNETKIFSQKGIVWVNQQKIIEYLPPIEDKYSEVLYIIRLLRPDWIIEQSFFRINNYNKAIEYGYKIKEIDENTIVHIMELKSEYDNNTGLWFFISFNNIKTIII